MTAYEQAQAKLRELAAKVEAGTPGPWRHTERGIEAGQYDEVVIGGPVSCMSYCLGGSSTLDGDRIDLDADLLTTAVNLLPGFVALCESVLERHRPIPCDDADCATEPHDSCLADGHDYPCPEARAVLTALGVGVEG